MATIILPMTWLKNLSMLAYVYAAGLVSSVALTVSLLWAGVVDKGFHVALESEWVAHCPQPLLPLLRRPWLLPNQEFALMLLLDGWYILHYFGVGVGGGGGEAASRGGSAVDIFTVRDVFYLLENQIPFFILVKVLVISSVLCSLNYAVTTMLGYLIYGEVVQVTLNLPTGKLYTRITIRTTLITPLAKYALPITTVNEEKLSATTVAAADAEHNGLTRVLTSTAVVVSTVVLACTVPFFSYLMPFNGSSLNVTIVVLFPCLSYLKIYMPRFGVGRFEVAAIVGILVIGVCIAFAY
uniref:Amino acid transporter transmembrane domain-containing protein n=1 Tax=Oryza barthii TaxID=65489 RepID=A0A0D3EQM1_9ORYZ